MKITKSIILTIMLISGTLLFTSCPNDDDSGQDNSIVGTFLSTSIVEEQFIDNVS